MMVAACAREMMPALTKPMVITVVAPELWMAAVPSTPIPARSVSKDVRIAVKSIPVFLQKLFHENECFVQVTPLGE